MRTRILFGFSCCSSSDQGGEGGLGVGGHKLEGLRFESESVIRK